MEARVDAPLLEVSHVDCRGGANRDKGEAPNEEKGVVMVIRKSAVKASETEHGGQVGASEQTANDACVCDRAASMVLIQ